MNTNSKSRLYPIWLLALILPVGGRYRRVLTAAVIMALLWLVLNALDGKTDNYEKLFFAAVIAYSIAIFSRIIMQSQRALDEIARELDAPGDVMAEQRLSISHKSALWIIVTTVGAVTFGLLHLTLIYGSRGAPFNEVFFSGHFVARHIGTIATWLVMTTNISALFANALLWASVGRSIEIDLFRPGPACIIGRTAVLSTLSVIGAQVLFVILIMGQGWDWVSVFPGLAASFAPAMLLFFIPVWPLHKRLQGARQSMLIAVDDDIRKLGPISEARIRDGTAIDQFNRLLVMRREVQQVSTWPFDGTNLLRIAFYLLLIPLTWVGAALVENVVDLFLV
ncbi:MAG: hypothetical protein V7754_18155 [Halioglobus sp.]